MTPDEIKVVLSRIKFAPSCIDMGWEWEVRAAYSLGSASNILANSGYHFRTSFQKPDRTTGKVTRGFGRWWHISHDATESAIVKTVFAAAKLILEHELMEAFKYAGFRIFDPHHTVDDLITAASFSELMKCPAT